AARRGGAHLGAPTERRGQGGALGRGGPPPMENEIALTSRGGGLGLHDVAAARALHVPAGLVGHQRPALGARIGRRALPHREVAVRVPVAAVERLALAGPLRDQLALAALWARDPGPLLLLLDVLAVGVAGAPDERAVPADPLQEWLAALGAGLAGLLRLGAGLPAYVARVRALGPVLAPDELPAPAELDHELAGLAPLLALQQRGDDRGVRGRAADPELLQRLHQARLGEPGRRLREVLLGQDLEQAQGLLGGEPGEPGLGVLVGLLVLVALEVHATE